MSNSFFISLYSLEYTLFEVSSATECRDGVFFLLIHRNSIYFLNVSPLSGFCTLL